MRAIALPTGACRKAPYTCQLEWISSGGLQYAQTNSYIDPDATYTVVFNTYEEIPSAASRSVFGAFNFQASGQQRVGVYLCAINSRSAVYFTGETRFVSAACDLEIPNVEHTVVLSKSGRTVDGIFTSWYGATPTVEQTSRYKIMILGFNGNNLSSKGVCVKSLKVEKGGVVIENYIPVIKDGVPCFCNLVDEIFYYNLGSGTFGYKTQDGTVIAPII